jgi:hypothetical protein
MFFFCDLSSIFYRYLRGTPRETQPFEKMRQIGNHPGDLKTVFSDSPEQWFF